MAPSYLDRLLNERPEWQDDALCAQTDPEEFYPEKGGNTRLAKAICQRCDVREQCLQYALDHGERYGIWGGVTERERRKLKPATPTVHRPHRPIDPALIERGLAMIANGSSIRAAARHVGVNQTSLREAHHRAAA